MQTVHLIITGKVQGVFFRESARKVAEKLHIKGWIQNTPDGNVEAIISGAVKDIDKFVAWCRKGPERAEVKDVQAKQVSQINFTRFEVKRL